MERHGYTISELARTVDGQVVGDGDRVVERVSGLEEADERTLVFIEDARLFARVAAAPVGCCISPPLEHTETAVARIEVRNPKLAFAVAAGMLHPPRTRPAGVHPTAVVAPGARIDPTAHVGPHVHVQDDVEVGPGTRVLAGAYLGEGVRVGRDCTLHPNVVLYEGVVVGDRVTLHAGVVLGADGFGYVRAADGYVKFPQIGGVVIEDDVEVGANSCIDRGALGTTRVGRGTKIDDLVMVAHNVQVGARVIMAGQVGISGSTRIGDDVLLAGQVGLADHVHLQDRVQVGAKSAVFPGKVVPAGTVVMGIPARPIDRYKQVSAVSNRLPAMREELAALRAEVERLRERIGEAPAAPTRPGGAHERNDA